jgi:uncharacterized protein YprB with RNaseH-like and TPR domain
MNDFVKLQQDRSGPIKIGILDIETSNLQADIGYIMAVCVKEVNPNNLKGRTYTIRIDDKRNPDPFCDKWVIEQLVQLMNEFDLIITWYGSCFDIPFINSRALFHKIMPPVKNFRRDLCFVARGIGKLRNNKLVTWGNFLFGKSGKTSLQFDVWLRAMRGDKQALDYIVLHCQKDVLETEKINKKFIPLLGKLKKR